MALVVTRFAPSPTGHLHIGGARSALFCWAYAHRMRREGHDGRFMIRIEDTDQARSSDESARGILEDLAWLGIEWDDGPVLKMDEGPKGTRTVGGDSRGVGSYFQAQRVPLYHKHIQWMIENGKAYPAFEGSDELEAKRKAAVAAKQTYRYDRASWNKYPTPEARLARMKEAKAKGEPYVIRFYAPHEPIVVKDEVLGDVKYAAGEMDDFVILKADGFPTYHFAVVIDDETMGVTHIMRAQEHLINTPRHVALQRALKHPDTGVPFKTPVYAHMPLIFNMDGSKMSKRDKAKFARKSLKDAMAKAAPAGPTAASAQAAWLADLARETNIDGKMLSDFANAENDSLDIAEAMARKFKLTLPEVEVDDFRKNGYLPEAIINFLGLLGWNPGMKLPDGKDLEKFDMKFIAENFSIERIGRTNAKFDRTKLASFNGDAIAALSDEAFLDRWLAWMKQYEGETHARISAWPRDKQLLVAKTVKPRAKTLREALKPIGFAFVTDDGYAFDQAAVDKQLLANDRAGLKLLAEFAPRLEAISSSQWNPETLNAAIDGFAKEKGMPNPGGIAQPIRVALTGAGVSPGLGETMTILGRESSLKRVKRCLAEIGG